MKHEWKKHEKNLYGAKKIPTLIEASKQNFIMIDGKGNPNYTDFSDKVSALYSLAYAIKMNYKSMMSKNYYPGIIHDFIVYPLEGIWKQKESTELIKDKLEYTIMIRQPDFINKDMVNTALETVKKKKPNQFYKEIYFDTMQDGKCVEILHIGSYDDETASFEKMDDFTKKNGFNRSEIWHREIYLNNANRVLKSKLNTILRYTIK